MINKILKYETYVFVGFLLVAGTIAKLIFHVQIDSDWFWFIAGLALALEGMIDLIKQRQFNKKFKVISRDEFDEMQEKILANKK